MFMSKWSLLFLCLTILGTSQPASAANVPRARHVFIISVDQGDTSVILLTADHGSHDVKDASGRLVATHGSAEAADVTIPWIAWGRGVKPHFTITAPVVQYDTAATALWLLGVPVPESFWGRPVTSAFE
jgi:arylsulfatase A-like enzyme